MSTAKNDMSEDGGGLSFGGKKGVQKVPTEERDDCGYKDGEWDYASCFVKWTFSVVTPMITRGLQSPLQFEDLMLLSKDDRAEDLTNRLAVEYDKCVEIDRKAAAPEKNIVPRLVRALVSAYQGDLMMVTMPLTFLEGICRIGAAMMLRFLLEQLESGQKDGNFDLAYVIAALMGLNMVGLTFIHHVLFFYTMRLGWRWKIATTGFIYRKLFRLKSAEGVSTETGKLTNLVSNDVFRFELFAIFGCFFFSAPFEVLVCLSILCVQLDIPSAFAGFVCTVAFVPLQLKLSGVFSRIRTRTAGKTDNRVRCISEVFTGISSVKSYAWESPFNEMIRGTRQLEIDSILNAFSIRSVNQALYYFVPTLAAFATFTAYSAGGGQLTLPLIFSSLGLLIVLRASIGRHFTQALESGSEAFGSAKRIDTFLNMVVQGPQSDDAITVEREGHTHADQSLPPPPPPPPPPTTSTSSAAADGSATTGVSVEMANMASAEKLAPLPLASLPPSLEGGKEPLALLRGSFSHGKVLSRESADTQGITHGGREKEGSCHTSEEGFMLHDIDFAVHPGELVFVVGAVGAGKSSLISAMLGNLSPCTPFTTRRVTASKALVGQKPWIMAASIRSNVVLAGGGGGGVDLTIPEEKMDLPLYAHALESCRLVEDMEDWPAYDMTEIGERGLSVSGGQKARISLARAVYSDRPLMLLDEPLGAVDARTGKALFHECIVPLRRAKKGIVLCTHQLQYLPHADTIVVMDGGHQRFRGTWDELSARRGEFSYLDLPISGAQQTDVLGAGAGEGSAVLKPSGPSLKRSASSGILAAKTFNKSTSDDALASELKRQHAAIIEEEDRNVGTISRKLWGHYMCRGGVWNALLAVFLLLMSQILMLMADYWVRWWASEEYGSQDSKIYPLVYGILVLAAILMGYGRARHFFALMVRASTSLHNDALLAVIRAPLTFFNANPAGRVLNRFAKDQNQIDELFPTIAYDCAQNIVLCVSSVILVVVAMPWAALMLPAIAWYFVHMRTAYVVNSRELKRMEAVSRSPIYADFSATLDGIETLLAYELEDKMTGRFNGRLEHNARAWFSFLMLNRWFGFRLDSQCTMIVIVASLLSVLLCQHSDLDVGLVGFALVYVLQLGGLFQYACRQSAEVEDAFTAVERLQKYSDLPSEEGYLDDMVERPGANAGHIVTKKDEAGSRRRTLELKDLTARYRADLEPRLRHANLVIPPGTKVGVCGRTGSGKSTLLLALLRLNIISSGDLVLGNESLLNDYDLQGHRRQFASIGQEAHFFSGTIRFNLDPFSEYTDEQIWAALEDARCDRFVKALPQRLQEPVAERGSNFSVGQTQLLSLARAILRLTRASVVLCDEVTASVDYQTDRLIQETLRSAPAFQDCTIVTIAHRLRTIADYDMICVVSSGEISEVGTPAELLSDKRSLFHSLCEESGEMGEIMSIAGLTSRAL